METSRQKDANIKLLVRLVDVDDAEESDYCFLVDGQHVRYVTTAPGAFRGHEDDRTFEPILLGELFPAFPGGSWSQGHVSKDAAIGEIAFVKTETVQLASVENV